MIQKLQKNKYLKILVSFFFILLIAFNVFSIAAQPVNAAVVVDDVVLLVIASVCLGLAMNIAVTNPNWGNTFSGLYDALSTTSKTYVNEAAKSIGQGYTIVYDWQVDRYEQLTDEIIEYFRQNSFDEVPGTITPSNANGKIGFTADTSFTLYYPNGTNSVTYYLPSGQLRVFAVASKSDFPNIPAINNVHSFNMGYIVTNSEGFGYYSLQWNSTSNNTYDSYWSPYRIQDYDSSYLRCNKSNISLLSCGTEFGSSNASFFMDTSQNVYTLSYLEDHLWHFVNTQNGNFYNNLSFSTKGAAKSYFWRSLGFAVSGDTDVPAYSPPVTDNGITFDYDTSVSAQTANVSGAIDGAISTVIPGTAADLGTLADTPGAVLNPAVAASIVGIYPDDIPQIDKVPNLWLQKFPFCVPFDLANLITSLQSPPEAPVFSLLVIPADSFGLDNEDIYFTIDFQPYSQLVAILRFFLSLSFLVFLIILTRNIIRG